MPTSSSGGVRRALVLLALPLLLATTYRWRDSEGQLHLTDAPPPPGVAYEVLATPHDPPRAAAPTTPAQEPRPIASAPPERVPVVDEAGQAARSAELDRRCVEALYQLELLGIKQRVFRPGPGATRTYLDDRDRPSEIERLARARDETCVGDEARRVELERQADVLLQSLSPACREDRERLEYMRRDPRTPRRDLEAREARVNQSCPETPALTSRDLWLSDWILVR